MGITRDITHIAPGYEALKPFVSEFDEHTAFAPSEKVFHVRNRLYRHREDDTVLSVKSFRIPNIINRVAYSYLRDGKARRSFNNAAALLQNGIATPAPIAWREIYRGGLLAESYYISEFLDNAREIRGWEESPQSEQLADITARTMALLHSKGIYFRDFSPGNLLYDNDWNVYLVDVNRMEFNCHNPKTLMRNFRAISLNLSDVERLAHVYCKYTPFTGISHSDIVREAIRQKKDYIAEKAWHQRFKSLLHK